MENIPKEGLFNNDHQFNKKQFKFYKDFQSEEEAKAFVQLLREHHIPFLASKPEVIIDEAIVGTRLFPKVVIKIKPEDFMTVNQLIGAEIAALDYADLQEHYLNMLENNELEAVLQKPDEWSVEDVNVASVLLRGRGVPISDKEVLRLRAERLQEIRAGKKGNPAMMTLYFLGIAIGIFSSIIFILAGIGMGYYYSYSKSVDLDGQPHFVFEPTTRKYGRFILYGGIGVLVLEILGFFIFAWELKLFN